MINRLLVLIFACINFIPIGSSAQTIQSTLGPCGNNIANVHGKVTITCVYKGRIRVAKLSSNLDVDHGLGFLDFITKNNGKIIELDIFCDGESRLYEDTGSEKRVDLYQSHFKISEDPRCKDIECTGSIIYGNDNGAPSLVEWRHGDWTLSGFFLVEGGHGGQGWLYYFLRPLDRETILLSDKYITEADHPE